MSDGFTSYVHGRQHALLRTAWLLTGGWGLAEDLVQTVLVKVWPRFDRVASAGDPDAYVRQALFRTYVSWRRIAWRRETTTASWPETSVSSDPDLRLVLQQVLPLLPPRQRAVVVLRYVEDLTEVQTAQLLGCAVGTVKSQNAKALAALRGHLDHLERR